MTTTDDQYDEEGPTPELDEVQQWEPEASALDVDVRGPVRTHALPARIAIMHSVIVTSDRPVQLFGRDERRARVLLWATADATAVYHLGTRDDEVAQETAARPLAVADDGTGGDVMVLEFKHCEPLYAKADTGTVTISFLLEQWAD